jgi:hypothetical protein
MFQPAAWMIVAWVCNPAATECIRLDPQPVSSYAMCEQALPRLLAIPPPANMRVLASCINIRMEHAATGGK